MKDMKWLYNMVITFFAAGCLTACSDYLEVDSNFKDRLTIEKYLLIRIIRMRGFPILILICDTKIKMWVEKRACLRILPMTFIGRIGIMREMVNIPMVVIILFQKCGIQ